MSRRPGMAESGLDPIGEAADRPSLTCGPRLDPIGEVRYYSLRRLLPYQGTVQVIEMSGFRAMSPDGITWQVQIANRAADGEAGRSRRATHGTWRADGSGDLIETDRTRPFVQRLRGHPRLPFSLADRLELWLLDAEWRLPLALLAATFCGRTPPRIADTRWQACVSGETGFVSPSVAVQQAVEVQADGEVTHGSLLARLVREAAGEAAQAQWFERAADGSGAGLGGPRLGAGLEGRRLSPEAFPELLVRERWENDMAGDLVRDFHAWLAPSLLTHDNLSRATREWLEQAACRQPERLYRLRYLLPDVVNTDRLKVALVEAVMRRAAEPASA